MESVRTGLQGLKIYLTPDMSGITVQKFLQISFGCNESVILLIKCFNGNYDYIMALM